MGRIVDDAFDSIVSGAVRTAIDLTGFPLHPMADDTTLTVPASGS
jgi:hypothetical protein